MKFSQRVGITPIEKAIQLESLDIDLRNSLWSLLTAFYWDTFDRSKYDMGFRSDRIKGSNLDVLFTSMWLDYFKEPIDTIPELFYDGLPNLRSYFFEAEWYEVYDFTDPQCRKSPEIPPEKFPAQFDPKVSTYREYISNPYWRGAVEGNRVAIAWSDVVVLLLPAGADSHADWALGVGMGKRLES